MNCLRCGGIAGKGEGWELNAVWQWNCKRCNFKWDSEYHSVQTSGFAKMQYYKCDIERRLVQVPLGCLCVIFGEEI